jgi:hypothetical protein
VRRRWGTKRVAVEDLGDRVVLTPIPDDPVKALRGSVKLSSSTDELRRQARGKEADAVARR